MPRKTIHVLTCIGCGFDQTVEQVGPPSFGLPLNSIAGWISIFNADGSSAADGPELLCPTCTGNLPAPAVEVLRQQARASAAAARAYAPMFVHDAPAPAALAREPVPPALEFELPPLDRIEWGGATVDTQLGRLMTIALNQCGMDVGRAARMLVERWEALTPERKGEVGEALARAVIERIDMASPEDVAQWMTVAISAASPLIQAHRGAHGPNGKIHHPEG